MSCFSCGRTFKGSVNDLLAEYKREYENHGTVRWFYKLETNGDVFTCRDSSFKTIRETKIEPNFKNGAEYAHIQEYNRKTT